MTLGTRRRSVGFAHGALHFERRVTRPAAVLIRWHAQTLTRPHRGKRSRRRRLAPRQGRVSAASHPTGQDRPARPQTSARLAATFWTCKEAECSSVHRAVPRPFPGSTTAPRARRRSARLALRDHHPPRARREPQVHRPPWVHRPLQVHLGLRVRHQRPARREPQVRLLPRVRLAPLAHRRPNDLPLPTPLLRRPTHPSTPSPTQPVRRPRPSRSPIVVVRVARRSAPAPSRATAAVIRRCTAPTSASAAAARRTR